MLVRLVLVRLRILRPQLIKDENLVTEAYWAEACQAERQTAGGTEHHPLHSHPASPLASRHLPSLKQHQSVVRRVSNLNLTHLKLKILRER